MIITTRQLRPRDRFDHYPTDAWAVESALDQLLVPWLAAAPTRILDPGAGAGIWGSAARQRWRHARIVGAELRHDEPMHKAYDSYRYGDFLSMPWYESFDLVIGNPPYHIAEACVRRSLDLLDEGGYLIFLLRLAFMESLTRAVGLWRDYPCLDVGVYSKRPSFTGDGRTDATAYACFLWKKGYHGRNAFRLLLPATLEARYTTTQLALY